LGALFLVISLGLALINRSPSGEGVEAAGRQLAPEAGATWWQEDVPLDTSAPLTETLPELPLESGGESAE
jgi:preprotein translocase subunit SecG